MKTKMKLTIKALHQYLEDLTDEDLKSMIEDVIKDMIKDGEIEAGHDEMGSGGRSRRK